MEGYADGVQASVSPARDNEIVRWIGRLRMVQAAQVGERFRLGRAVTYARLSGLVKLGLLEHARVFHGAPGVCLATRAGLAVVDIGLPPARIDCGPTRTTWSSAPL